MLLNTDDKIIVVSQWMRMLIIIRGYLKEDGIEYTELTGETVVNQRHAIVKSFNNKGGKRVRIF